MKRAGTGHQQNPGKIGRWEGEVWLDRVRAGVIE